MVNQHFGIQLAMFTLWSFSLENLPRILSNSYDLVDIASVLGASGSCKIKEMEPVMINWENKVLL